jgi:Protein of unknown function (DUF4242)
MPLQTDVHNMNEGVTCEAVREPDKKDVDEVSEEAGNSFCLVEAPDREEANRVHREAHGLVADEIYEVQEGS